VDHIQPLVEQFADGSWFAKFRAELPEEHNLHVIFHLCGPAVLADSRYRNFMNSFPANVEVCLLELTLMTWCLLFTSST
jgi:hypothetical protein